jgi:hypothetical protein
MRLLRRSILLRMARTGRDMAELQSCQQLAHRALVQLHPEPGGDLVTQVDQPPAHHLVPLRVRSLPRPFGHKLRAASLRFLPSSTNASAGARRACTLSSHPAAARLSSDAERSSRVIATDMFRSPCLNMLRIASSRVAPNQKRVNASGVWYEKLRDKIEGRLTRIKRMPQLIRSFFVVYITGC